MAGRIANIVEGPFFKEKTKRPKSRRPVHQGKDKGYLAFLHTLECCVTGTTGRLVAHHPTVGRGRMGRKEDDSTAVPVTEEYHSDQYPTGLHNGERAFWNRWGIDPTALADDLYALYMAHGPDAKAAGHEVIRFHRQFGQMRVRNGIKIFDEKFSGKVVRREKD